MTDTTPAPAPTPADPDPAPETTETLLATGRREIDRIDELIRERAAQIQTLNDRLRRATDDTRQAIARCRNEIGDARRLRRAIDRVISAYSPPQLPAGPAPDDGDGSQMRGRGGGSYREQDWEPDARRRTLVLLRGEVEGISPGNLEDLLQLSKGKVRRITAWLVEQGHVTYTGERTSRRYLLTEQGAAMLTEASARDGGERPAEVPATAPAGDLGAAQSEPVPIDETHADVERERPAQTRAAPPPPSGRLRRQLNHERLPKPPEQDGTADEERFSNPNRPEGDRLRRMILEKCRQRPLTKRQLAGVLIVPLVEIGIAIERIQRIAAASGDDSGPRLVRIGDAYRTEDGQDG